MTPTNPLIDSIASNFRLAMPTPIFRPTRPVALPVPISAQPITNTQVGSYANNSDAASQAFTEAGNLKLKNIQQVGSGAGTIAGPAVQRIVQVVTKGNPILLTYSFTLTVGSGGQAVAFFRDGMQISPTYSMHATAGIVTMTPCLIFIDTGAAAGSHSYEVWAQATTTAFGDSFQVIELG